MECGGDAACEEVDKVAGAGGRETTRGRAPIGILPLTYLWDDNAVLLRCELRKFLQQTFDLWHPFMAVADESLCVDQVGDASAAVLLADRSVICHQRKGQAEGGGERLMRFRSVSADAQNLGMKRFKTGDLVLKHFHLVASAGGEVGIERGENHRPLTKKVAKNDLAVG